jgi:hypothetical protein
VDRTYRVGIRRAVPRLVDAASVRLLIDWPLNASQNAPSLRASTESIFITRGNLLPKRQPVGSG